MTDKTTHISIKEFLKIAGDNFEQGRYQASLELYAAILKAKPDILIANLRMAEKNESFGNHKEAAYFTKILLSTILWTLGFYLAISVSKSKLATSRKRKISLTEPKIY